MHKCISAEMGSVSISGTPFPTYNDTRKEAPYGNRKRVTEYSICHRLNKERDAENSEDRVASPKLKTYGRKGEEDVESPVQYRKNRTLKTWTNGKVWCLKDTPRRFNSGAFGRLDW